VRLERNLPKDAMGETQSDRENHVELLAAPPRGARCPHFEEDYNIFAVLLTAIAIFAAIMRKSGSCSSDFGRHND
jgi:hypothetical protein